MIGIKNKTTNTPPTSFLKTIISAIVRAQKSLEQLQKPDGHWLFELEADVSMPAEYVLMMHHMNEIDFDLQNKIAHYLRKKQQKDGGWQLYPGGDFDLSCSVKAYYALKLCGDGMDAEHMQCSRNIILKHGGASKSNVFTRFILVFFGQIPWRAVPFTPVEIILLPKWFPIHMDKMAYWARVAIVPLSILYTKRVRAKNPNNIGIEELFITVPKRESDYFPVRSVLNRIFLILEQVSKAFEFLIPNWLRSIAIKKAEAWMIERLNGENGIGAILPPMIFAHEALAELGYSHTHEYRITSKKALKKLVVEHDTYAYAQPCVSPVWDTAISVLALLESYRVKELQKSPTTLPQSALRGMEWLKAKQILKGNADWKTYNPNLEPGGWPFQYANDFYPDLDDTAMIVWGMREIDLSIYRDSIDRATQWIMGMQSSNGGYGAFDKNNDSLYLNELPFADHGALLDPPSADVSARCLLVLSAKKKVFPQPFTDCLSYIKRVQEENGSWYGRWGTNYIYGTWSVLTALYEAHIEMQQAWIQKAANWLIDQQRYDGGWGESNDTYDKPVLAGTHSRSTNVHTSWAVLALIASGHQRSVSVKNGIAYLLKQQNEDGTWIDKDFNAPGFPRFFYLLYHGYSRYFPLWALARYHNTIR